MALAAASVFEIQTGGNDTNGGGFVTGASGTDFSLVATKRTATGSNDSTTDAVAVGTGVITSVTAAFTAAIVGNIIFLSGGTGVLTGGWYQVITFTSATSITVDRNVATGTGITMNIGGALASPGTAASVGLVAGNIVYQKAGTYSITSVSTNVSGGCPSITVRLIWEGYQTTRGDMGTKPVLQASGISTATIFTIGATDALIQNIVIDGAGLTSIRGFSIGRSIVNKCGSINCTNNAFNSSAGSLSQCYATGCSTGATFLLGNTIATNCIAYDNTVIGFSLGNNCFLIRCIADTNTGAGSDGFQFSGAIGSTINCVAYANGRDGFRAVASFTITFQNCIAETNAGFGYIIASGAVNTVLNNCASFNNTSGATSGTFTATVSFVTGTGSFFTNAAGQDFSLNNTAGAGALARATGYPGVLPVGGTGFSDIGALQHADPAGSGGGIRLAGAGGLAVG